jgi:hypothetical protein
MAHNHVVARRCNDMNTATMLSLPAGNESPGNTLESVCCNTQVGGDVRNRTGRASRRFQPSQRPKTHPQAHRKLRSYFAFAANSATASSLRAHLFSGRFSVLSLGPVFFWGRSLFSRNDPGSP